MIEILIVAALLALRLWWHFHTLRQLRSDRRPQER